MHEVWSARLGSLTQLCEGGVSRDHGGRAACACVHASSRLPAGRPEAQDNQSVFLGAEGRRCVRFSRHPGGRGHRGGTVTRPLDPRPTRRRTLKVKDEVRQTVCLFELQRALLLGRQTPRPPSHTRGQRSAEL